MNRFATLMQREWMQHRLGWIILMAAPFLITLVATPFNGVHVSFSDGETVVESAPDALLLAFGCMAGLGLATMVLAAMFSLFQAPGLARRDHQDRSIEFWLSLPVGHVPSVGATLLVHLLLVPWLALGAGAIGGLLVSLAVVIKTWSVGAWFGLPWGAVIGAEFAILTRLLLGYVLALLWLSPLVLLTMAASAWFKRWGVPLVVAVIGGGGLVADKAYHQTFVWDTLRYLLKHASQALIVAERAGQRSLGLRPDTDPLSFVQGLPAWAMHDLGAALQAMLAPGFVAALAVAGLGFALLVLRRLRGA